MIRRPPRSPLFPSPTLSRPPGRSRVLRQRLTESRRRPVILAACQYQDGRRARKRAAPAAARVEGDEALEGDLRMYVFARGDRKSTRLNSSHLVISYAVFCLK